ncbi:MAG: alpha/beta hydrolase, partial [Bdellovibrionota bacterium]
MADKPRAEKRKLTKEGSIETAEGWIAAYRYLPGEGAPVVFLNGLGDELASWTWFADRLEGRSRLQIDLRGQGRSLHSRRKTHPESDYRIPIAEQSRDLARVLDDLGLDEKVILCGFSYGGGVALDFASRWPDRIEKLALVVPFVIRLDHAFPMQRFMTWQWRALKTMGVLPSTVSATVENAYEEFLSAYMNQRYEKRLEDPHSRKVAVQLSHGIMGFNTFDVLGHLPDGSVHMLTSELDTLVPRSLYVEFWNRLPESKRGSWTKVSPTATTCVDAGTVRGARA